MKRALAYAIAVAGFAASAQAADLSVDAIKDPLPDQLSWHGVTVYGTIDVGGVWSQYSAPASGASYNAVNYSINSSKYVSTGLAAFTNNALEQSKIGVKIEEDVFAGLKAVGKIETGFNPISGELADACASLLRNNGRVYQFMDQNGDGSRCGQAFNSVAYGGLSSPLYGTLTFGRQTSLVLDGMNAYDPMVTSYAFSLNLSGTPGGGIGSTETARWDDAVKYIFTYGPFHAAGMYSTGGQDTPIFGNAYAANVGFTYKGLSVDGYYTKENGAVSAAFFNNPLYSSNQYTYCSTAGGTGNCINQLLGTITNNEAWDVMAKYTFELGEPASLKDAPCGGLKDAPCAPPDKVTLFGGFQYVTMSNPEHPQSWYNDYSTIGGYQLFTNQNFLKYGSVGDIAYGTDRVVETAWAGAKYETGPWALVAAYYWYHQNDYITASARNCVSQTAKNVTDKAANHFAGYTVGTNCAGDVNQGSFLVDYTFNKHLDVYAGVTLSEIGGGLSSGYLQDTGAAVTTGLRLKF